MRGASWRLPDAALDRGSLQVALMRDLAAANALPTYQLADEDSIAEYDYTDNGTATMPTGSGSVATRILTAQRAGSVAYDVAVGRAGAALSAGAHRAASRRRGANRVRAHQRQRLDREPLAPGARLRSAAA